PVGELNIGAQVSADNGWAYVTSMASLEERQTVYNFEVEGTHTYFVGTGGVWAHNVCAARGAANPLKGTTYTGKVRQQMRPGLKTGRPDNHGFPLEVDNFAGQGTRTTIKGGDGVVRTKVELRGGYKGKEGIFEWIIEPDKTVNHRLFVPDL
ncbi:MAG: hypothetical protein MJE77_29750, partial [Proteobacteria bacterium]|nr:hypothetical protein [Pseudomonadota bacterium]